MWELGACCSRHPCPAPGPLDQPPWLVGVCKGTVSLAPPQPELGGRGVSGLGCASVGLGAHWSMCSGRVAYLPVSSPVSALCCGDSLSLPHTFSPRPPCAWSQCVTVYRCGQYPGATGTVSPETVWAPSPSGVGDAGDTHTRGGPLLKGPSVTYRRGASRWAAISGERRKWVSR